MNSFVEMSGPVCIEVLLRCYLKALDNGTFSVGDLHEPNEAPDQEEIFTCIRSTDTQIALKSGYNKYLGIDAKQRLIGRSDAIGDRELFEPVFEEGKLAILAHNKNFLSYDQEEHTLFATGRKVTDNELLKMRSNVDPAQVRLESERAKVPEEERGDLRDCEEKYMRKYQSKPDVKSTSRGYGNLIRAKNEGNLHETLLDRRAKLKSDKFCK